jgi:hypothetical protein
MRRRFLPAITLCSFFAIGIACNPANAQPPSQPDPAWRVHDANRPRPVMVDPGVPSTYDHPGKPPSDAVVLFDGTDLSRWASMDGGPAQWVVKDGAMECAKGSGYLRTLQNFGDCQLHIEWAAPTPPQGQSQGRGNSGVFLMGLYEVQVLDSYENKTYADGQAGAAYGQYPPLVNASRPPGQWQIYDVIFTAPEFSSSGEVVSPARFTVLHNGVLVQNNVALTGPTGWMKREPYKAHPDKLPLSLQDHGNPVRCRNIWVRGLERSRIPEFTFSDAVLDRCVGSYELDPNTKLKVSRREHQLQMRVVNPTREHAYDLFAAATNRFFAKTVDAELVFGPGTGDQAPAVTFSVGGDSRPARKLK